MAKGEDLDPAEMAVYFALLESGRLLQYALEQQIRRDGDLSFVQFQILAGLHLGTEHGRERMTDIADRVVYSRSGLTYQARELERRGLVERVPDPDDDRGTVVVITGAGRKLIGSILPDHQDVVREMLIDHLDPADAATLTRVLGELRDRMREQPPRSARPRRKPASS
ncbi:MarR family winged helix-turn-helix transcriptional regulator [Jatrophihabitans sp. YIM 134969]